MTPRSKLKLLSDDHAFSFCAPKLWNDSPELIQCKWSLNICSSKSNLKALKTSKRYFYLVVLFNNFVCQCYEALLSSRLSLKHLFDDDDGEPKTLGETQLQKHIGMSLSMQSK